MARPKKKGNAKRKIRKYKARKNRIGGIAGYLALRTLLFFLVVISCLAIYHYINLDQWEVVAKTQVVATAYSSTEDQTDDTPCITANGFDLCENGIEEIIANNGLKFGTTVRIPELFGGRIFIVADRMNSRYGSGRIDIWMKSREKAQNFGVRAAEMEIVRLAE